jgi:hypothetical protein
MIQLQDITQDNIQELTIPFDDSEIIFKMFFSPVVQQWFFDVEYGGRETNGVKLTVGVLHVTRRNYPFDFWVTDNSGKEVDPFLIDDFYNGRCSIFIVEPDEMAEIRGASVPV